MYHLHLSHPYGPSPDVPREIPSWADMLKAVGEITGRASVLSYPSVLRKLREGNRTVYVAGARGFASCWIIHTPNPTA